MKRLVYLKDVVTLSLDSEKCFGCGMCLEVCPHRVLARDNGKVRIEDRDACMECGACAKNCPARSPEGKRRCGMCGCGHKCCSGPHEFLLLLCDRAPGVGWRNQIDPDSKFRLLLKSTRLTTRSSRGFAPTPIATNLLQSMKMLETLVPRTCRPARPCRYDSHGPRDTSLAPCSVISG